jgi:predicted ATPase/DNA-binding CsgD family transcriptional regulator
MTKADTLIEPLTRREIEILALLAKHHTNKEIASSLNLSVNSVKWYARQIYGKLGVENRRQAVVKASELGLLTKFPFDEKSPLLPEYTDTFLFTKPASKPTHNLPLQLTSFIGRGTEIEQVKGLISTSRLVTLTGAGGVGKTRLALAVATQMLEESKDGVWLVELAPLGDPEIIPAAMASIFGVRSDQNRSLRTALLDFLREKEMLLIMDNCEHLIETCAELAENILRVCPKVRLLASSREALGIEGEVPFFVPSLSFPDPGKLPGIESLQGYDAVQLFLERARLVLPGFAITDTNETSLAQICQRLDGIPLALELAAARLQVLSLQQIEVRLDDRFRLLTGGSRRALPRHQTLHALIDWSYELLTEAERTLFRRLSVFAGGWTLKATEVVCTEASLRASSPDIFCASVLSFTEILDLLGELVNKSLITVERDGDKVRGYRMLETIRQYAQEKLVEAGEAEGYRDRHLDYFLVLAEESEPLLRGPELLHRLELLDSQIDNLRLALTWALGGECSERAIKGMRIGRALGFYWYARSLLDEGCEWLKNGLENTPEEEVNWVQLRAKVMFDLGFLVINTLDFTRIAEVLPLLEESIALFQECNDQLGRALAQCELGVGLMSKYITSLVFSDVREEYPLARRLAEQGLATCRELGKPHDLAFALLMSQLIYSQGMEFEKARKFGEEALLLCEKSGDRMIMGVTLMRLGSLALIQGDLAGARRYIQNGLFVAQELKDKNVIMAALTGLGQVAYFSQDFKQMETHFQASLALGREIGALIYQMFSLRNLGIATLRQGKLNQSREYYLENFSLSERVIWVENEWVKYDVNTFILGMAGIALELGQYTQATRLLGVVEAQFEHFFKPLDFWDQAEFNRIAGDVRIHLDEPTYVTAWSAEGCPLNTPLQKRNDHREGCSMKKPAIRLRASCH